MPIITFSVPTEINDKIKSQAIGDESENLAAKRILLTALGIGHSTPLLTEIEDTLKTLSDRLDKLEEERSDWPSKVPSDIDEILEDLSVRMRDLEKFVKERVNDQRLVNARTADQIKSMIDKIHPPQPEPEKGELDLLHEEATVQVPPKRKRGRPRKQ